MADFFRSKTVPRRTTAGIAMTDDYNDYGGASNDEGNVGARTGSGHQWPAVSSADIVEYDSSVAADTPTFQQQQTQFLLPQQQRQRTNNNNNNNNNSYSQMPGAAAASGMSSNAAAVYAGKSMGMSSVAPDDPANGYSRSKAKWKTRALYAFLTCLLAVVVVNLTLTLWFIRVTRFTSEGMGSMKITQGGLWLSGRTLITDRLVASAIRSRTGRPLVFESTANVTLTARNSQGRLLNSLKLTKDGLECAQASVFRVTDTRGDTLFSADRNKVIVGAQELRVTGSGGAVFQGSVQTPLVRADSRHDLRLESVSRKLELSGPQGVTIESRAGDITVSCLMDVKLQSIAGAIQIDAAKVFFKGLKTAKMTSNSAPLPAMSADATAATATGIPITDGQGGGVKSSAGQPNSVGKRSGAKKRSVEDKLPSVYQLCVCGNGKVFMSPPDGQCAADNESLVCR
ncbi:Hypothetical protein CINCED_3A023444 [Cinara cedri]|nr:Hypothetical protein CINCED_3A023444 [Cinara cedri]